MLLACAPAPVDPLSDAAPFALDRAQRDALPRRALGIALLPERATFFGVGLDASPATLAIDPEHPELAQSLWAAALSPYAHLAGEPVIVIAHRSIPHPVVDAALAEARRVGLDPVWIAAVGR